MTSITVPAVRNEAAFERRDGRIHGRECVADGSGNQVRELNGPRKTRAKRSWASLIAGLACALGGMIGFAYLLVGPFYRESGVLASGQRLPDRTWGLIDEGIEGLVLVQLLALVVEITGVAVGAYSHFRGNRGGAPVLWACTFLLSGQASVSFFGVGWLFAPSALLAIVSSVTARPRMRRQTDARED